MGGLRISLTGCFNFDGFFFLALTRRFLHLGLCGELINDGLVDVLVVGVEVTGNVLGVVISCGQIPGAGGLRLAGVEGVALDGAAGRGAALPGGVGVVAALLGLKFGKLPSSGGSVGGSHGSHGGCVIV